MEPGFYKHCLKKELERRCESNPKYSLRAFARALRIDPGMLSRILSNQTIPTLKTSKKILGMIDLDPRERDLFLRSVVNAYQSKNMSKISQIMDGKELEDFEVERIEIDRFRIVSDWYHYAILELTFLEGFESSPKWIAAELGLSEVETKFAIERLINVELLAEVDGVLKKTTPYITTDKKDVTAPALRRRHKQVMEKAIFSMENDPIEVRKHSAMTMSIDPDRLPEAKDLVEQFMENLCKFLDSGKRKRVYEFSCALFPLDGKRNDHDEEI